jgi:hypothetical protein
VAIWEGGIQKPDLQSPDGSQDFNWGYGGTGPTRLANALAADAFDNAPYAEMFAMGLRDALVMTLEKDSGFILSRDRVILESFVHFTDLVNRSRLPQGAQLRGDILACVQRRDEIREKMMNLLSEHALNQFVHSKFGVRQSVPGRGAPPA